MNKIKEELKSLSLDELLEKYSLEDLEKLLPIKDILMKFPDVEEDLEYLFSWDEISRNDCGRLIDFLKQNYSIDWVRTANIEKIDDGNTIKVFTEENYLSIKLNNEKTEASLKIDDCRTDKFIAKMENGKLNIYNLKKLEPGVLLSDEISRYAKDFKLIHPFNSDNLKPASYYLAVGDEYALGGKKGKLDDKKNAIKIPPFQVAIIKTDEIINMPHFLIGRWNIRVTTAYDGLLWVGGPQVDPGWVGHLYCPIYNLSDEEVVLEKGNQFATIDFVRTTPLKKESLRFDKKFRTIDDYNWRLKSALFTGAAQRIDDIEKKVSRVESIIGIVLTIIVILFAVISIFVTSSQKVQVSLPIWLYFSFASSIGAITISIYLLVRKSVRSRWFEILITLILSIIVIVIALLGAKFLWLN